MTNVRIGRSSKNLEENQKYLMGFAWVIPSELRLFEALPNVIMVDTIEKTNNEKRPLLTVGGEDSNGKMFIFLRWIMPNEQSWMFRWIFSVVMPSLITKKLLEMVCIIISDGDSQFFTQIDNTSRPYFKNARWIRCGWYLIHKGWDWHVDNALQFNNVSMTEYRDIKQILTSWMTSWMKGTCETRQEFKFSL